MADLHDSYNDLCDILDPVLTPDVFTWRLPEAPDHCVVLLPYPGEAPVQAFGRPGNQFEKPRFQLIVRGPSDDAEAAWATMRLALATLVAVNSGTSTSSGDTILAVRALTSPFLLKWDGERRPEVACNFEVEVELDV